MVESNFRTWFKITNPYLQTLVQLCVILEPVWNSRSLLQLCLGNQDQFTLRDAVGNELDHLERSGILEKVATSNWAAPIVPVPKSIGQLRLCGDYKVTINLHLKMDKYPLPKPEDLFTTLVGGQQFTKLDLRHTYQQMELDTDSQELVTINTHKRL